MDIGAELRQARERRGLSLDDLSARTKISLSALRAIENDEMQRLPGGIFTRGFLRAYAREVGVDPDAIAQRYTDEFETPADEPEGTPDRATADRNGESGQTHGSAVAFGLGHPRMISVIAALVVIAAAYFAFSRSHSSPSVDAARSQRPGEAVVATDGSSRQNASTSGTEIGTTGSPGTTRESASRSGTALRLELQPTRQCWISATADGRTVTYRLMEAGERQTIEAQNELVLRVGDPASLGFSINGTTGRPLGPPGEPVTVRMTPHNYRQFVGQ